MFNKYRQPSSRVLDSIQSPDSLSEMAFIEIKKAIIQFKLFPGSMYPTRQLAKELGISETPVKKALSELEAKGFLKQLPRRGVVINSLTVQDVSHLYTMRDSLEKVVIREIAPKLSIKEIYQIEKIHSKGGKMIQSMENTEESKNLAYQYIQIDREFHEFIARLTGNKFLVKAISDIRDLVDWMGFRALLRKERLSEVQNEHDAIIIALKSSDYEEAISKMSKHITITKNHVVRWFNSQAGGISGESEKL